MGKWRHLEIGTGNGKPVSPARESSQSANIQNAHWKHGNETKEARGQAKCKETKVLMLEMIGWHVDLFAEGSARLRGRKPNGFENSPPMTQTS